MTFTFSQHVYITNFSFVQYGNTTEANFSLTCGSISGSFTALGGTMARQGFTLPSAEPAEGCTAAVLTISSVHSENPAIPNELAFSGYTAGAPPPSPPLPPLPSPPPPSPPPPTLYDLNFGLWAWYDMASYNAAASVWRDKSGFASGRTATLSGVSLANSTAGTASSICPLSYLTGAPTSSISFNMPPLLSAPISICTVSRFTGGSSARVFQSTSAVGTNNWLHGHWNTYAGVVSYNGWVVGPGPAVSVPTSASWVFMCSSMTNASYVSVMINGQLYSSNGGGKTTPWQGGGTIGINAGGYGGEYSDFAVAELLVWNRALGSSELWQVSSTLAAKYCLPMSAAPPPSTRSNCARV